MSRVEVYTAQEVGLVTHRPLIEILQRVSMWSALPTLFGARLRFDMLGKQCLAFGVACMLGFAVAQRSLSIPAHSVSDQMHSDV